MLVQEYMSTDFEPHSCDEDAIIHDVLNRMTEIGCVFVLNDDKELVGIVTDGDLRRNMDGLMARTAGEVATRGPKVIRRGSLASEALHEMNSRKISALFVLDDEDRVAGLLHIHDCLRAGLG